MHSQPGPFATHTKLLTVIVIMLHDSGSCNMSTSLVADEPNAYMVKICSPGYYGPLCSLCLLHNAPPGEPRYGRTGTLNCQKCRYPSAFSHNHLRYLASHPCCWACFHCAVPIHVFISALTRRQILLLSFVMLLIYSLCHVLVHKQVFGSSGCIIASTTYVVV